MFFDGIWQILQKKRKIQYKKLQNTLDKIDDKAYNGSMVVG